MGSARVGQIDIMVAGMIPVANVEAKVRNAAVLVDEVWRAISIWIKAGELRTERLFVCVHEEDHHDLRFALFRPCTFGIERFVVHIGCREWDAAPA
jgi:hypothetical protein